MIPDPLQRTVHVPFRVRQGTIESLDGEPLPTLREGTVGHLVVSAYAFQKREQRQCFEDQRRASGLPAGRTLLFHVKPNGVWPEDHDEHVHHLRHGKLWDMLAGDFVAGTLYEPLEIELRGSKSARLHAAACYVPALDEIAISVNHAYTRISERFEPHRLSHTGNVFRKVYFQDEDDQWKPLEVLRLRAEVTLLRVIDRADNP